MRNCNDALQLQRYKSMYYRLTFTKATCFIQLCDYEKGKIVLEDIAEVFIYIERFNLLNYKLKFYV
jgi:hypothetical protein